MKSLTELIIAWIRSEGASRDDFVMVHSHPINSSDADEARQKFRDGKAIDGFIPIVFLDDQVDTPRLRSWLQADAIHRRNLI